MIIDFSETDSLRQIPDTTGIYMLLDREQRVRYIGKSIHLRQRVQEHLRDGAKDPHHRPRIPRREIGYIRIRTLPTELHALLVEDRLIKHYRPDANRRLCDWTAYCYLCISGEEIPALRILDGEEHSGEMEIFGPFNDRFSAEDMRQLACRFSGIRRCSGAVPRHSCSEGQFGNCACPCGETADEGKYQRAVAHCREFLRGNTDQEIEQLTWEMTESSENLEFEQAARCREFIRFLERYSIQQQFLIRFRRENMELAGHGWCYRFASGRLLESFPMDSPRRDQPFPAPRIIRPEDPRHVADRARIVCSYLKPDLK